MGCAAACVLRVRQRACAVHGATASVGGAHGRCWRIRERSRLLPPTRGPAEPAGTHALVASASRPCSFQRRLDKACGAGDEETDSSGAVKRHRTCSDALRALGPARALHRRVPAPRARGNPAPRGRPREPRALPRTCAKRAPTHCPLRLLIPRTAGELLQRLRTYGVRLGLVARADELPSGRFREMSLEENRGRDFGVFPDREAALAWLGEST